MSEAPAEAPQDQEAAPQETPAQEIDWKAAARKWEERAKSNKTELEAFTAKFEALNTEKSELSTKLQEYEAEKERTALVADVSKATGVPASALRGSTREELEAHAATLAELIKPSAPVIKGQERTPANVPDSPERQAVKSLFGNN